jgi:NADPH:quinone reductase-like Zn-dependent oxidoreductase
MKAVRFHENGGPEVLRYEDAPEPEIGPTEVLIGVKAAALNHLDLQVRRNQFGRAQRFPHILGCDIAGVVEAVGQSVGHVRNGQEVLVAPGIGCGACQKCFEGQDNLCPRYSTIGAGARDGGYAQYVSVPGANVIPKPPSLTFEEAAALPLVLLTAWHQVMTKGRCRRGEQVLVIAAGSGVGTMALQVAKLAGARVIAAAGSDAKLEKARERGADETINYTTHRLRDEAQRLTEGRGVDLVLDSVGGSLLAEGMEALVLGGRLVNCGVTSREELRMDWWRAQTRGLSLIGMRMGGKGELVEGLKFVASGQLKPVVYRVLPLEEAATAQRMMESRDVCGKLVLRVP